MRPVIDMIPKKAKIILVLESPYKDEVIHGHPLAGATGQAVTKYIKGRAGEESPFRNFQGPFGCELVRALDHVRLGIMNASLWPLDYRCYCYDRYHRHRIISHLDIIRRNPGSTKRQSRITRRLDHFLIKGFRGRLGAAVSAHPSCVFIPCGRVAESFLSRSEISGLQLIGHLPHPAQNGWHRLNAPLFDELLKKL